MLLCALLVSLIVRDVLTFLIVFEHIIYFLLHAKRCKSDVDKFINTSQVEHIACMRNDTTN